YEVEEKLPPLLGFFSFSYRFDSEFHFAEGFDFEVESEIPLYSFEHDLGQVLEVTKTSNTYRARLKRNIINSLANESGGYFALNRFPTLFVSTAQSWDHVGTQLLAAYNSRLADPSTSLIKSLVEKVRAKRTPKEQVRELINSLGHMIRYMGDWRSRFAGQVPRTLQAITESQFGDCKDFSLVAIRVLRELGYKAYFATVYADRLPVPSFYYSLPMNYFNHQIVYAQIGKDVYWLDPTSAADPSFVDDTISNRVAIVWENQKVVPRGIPAHRQADSGVFYKLVLTPQSQRRYGAHLLVETWGLESKAAHTDDSTHQVNRWLSQFFPDVKPLSQQLVMTKPPEGMPWLVREQGSGIFENIMDQSPLGEGFRFNTPPFLKAVLDVTPNWVSDFDFVFPSIRRYEIEIQNRFFLASGEETCEIESPWLNVSLRIENRENSGVLTYAESFRGPDIPNRELRGSVFRYFQERVRNCLVGRFMLVQAQAQDHLARSRPPMDHGSRGRPSSSGMQVTLKRIGSTAGAAKYQSRQMAPLTNPLPKRQLATARPGDPTTAADQTTSVNEKPKVQPKAQTKVKTLVETQSLMKKKPPESAGGNENSGGGQ
ncbi:MAG: hypothetical protein C5B49_04400, partial [Bdellovibrio sp.]